MQSFFQAGVVYCISTVRQTRCWTSGTQVDGRGPLLEFRVRIKMEPCHSDECVACGPSASPPRGSALEMQNLNEMEQHLIQDPAFTAGSCVVPVPSVQGPHRVARSEGALLELVLQVDPCVFAGLLSQGWVIEDALSVLPGSP